MDVLTLKIVFGIFAGCYFVLFLGMVVLYALAAAAQYSQHNADPEYKDYAGEAFSYEVGLAYVLFAVFVLVLSETVDKIHPRFFLYTDDQWSVIGATSLAFLSWGLVHKGCIQLGRKFPQLHNLSWLG